jgi:hypothetical protein
MPRKQRCAILAYLTKNYLFGTKQTNKQTLDIQ